MHFYFDIDNMSNEEQFTKNYHDLCNTCDVSKKDCDKIIEFYKLNVGTLVGIIIFNIMIVFGCKYVKNEFFYTTKLFFIILIALTYF